jgi:hypothetical protein
MNLSFSDFQLEVEFALSPQVLSIGGLKHGPFGTQGLRLHVLWNLVERCFRDTADIGSRVVQGD